MPTLPTASNTPLPPTPGTIEEVPLVLRDLIVQLQTALAEYGTTINSLVDGQFNAIHGTVAEPAGYPAPGNFLVAAPEGAAIIPISVSTVSLVQFTGMDSTFADKGQMVWLTNVGFIQPFTVSNNNVASAAADRFLVSGASDLVVVRSSIGFWRMPADFNAIYPEGRWVALQQP